jgi:hypothetical protein
MEREQGPPVSNPSVHTPQPVQGEPHGPIDPDTTPYDDTHPVAQRIAGDERDDDGRALDDMFEANPDLRGLRPPLGGIGQRPKEYAELKPITRLMTARLAVQAGWEAALLVPADRNRRKLLIWVTGATATDYLLIGESATNVESDMLGFPIFAGPAIGPTVIDLGEHTGSVYVGPPPTGVAFTGPATIVALSVTM